MADYVRLFIPVTKHILSNERVQSLMKSNTTFDVVIIENNDNKAHYALARHFKAPLVLFFSMGANEWINGVFGNPQPPSYMPNSFSGYSSEMNLIQRVRNLAFYIAHSTITHFFTYPVHNKIVRKYFPHIPDLKTVMNDASLALLNSHPSATEPVPLLPNMIEIGGFHITEEPIEQDVKEFLDASKDGVVYFSLGSNARSKDLGKTYLRTFLEVFGDLNETVLWKFESKSLPEKPANVKIQKWLPQRAVLGKK